LEKDWIVAAAFFVSRTLENFVSEDSKLPGIPTNLLVKSELLGLTRGGVMVKLFELLGLTKEGRAMIESFELLGLTEGATVESFELLGGLTKGRAAVRSLELLVGLRKGRATELLGRISIPVDIAL
jgi:hypothetical protein